MLKSMIEEEIRYEKEMLNKIRSNISLENNVVLTYTHGHFYYRTRGKSSKLNYIRSSDYNKLRIISGTRFMTEKANILLENIKRLEKVLPALSDYDEDSIIKRLPKAHVKAAELLKEKVSREVHQSENPKHRENLVIVASNGVRVRTKGELNLLEVLLSYDCFDVRYEKELTLKKVMAYPDGHSETVEVKVYPDFTIILPDRSQLYWELSGLYDNPKYRSEQFNKFNLYYDNGIYIPKNLIVTMESQDKPLDMTVIRSIIESQILPLCK